MTMQIGKQMSMLTHSTDAGGLYQASFSLSSPPSKVGFFLVGREQKIISFNIRKCLIFLSLSP